MNTDSIQKILSNPKFLKELDRALESGKGMDYGYDPDTLGDTCQETFEVDIARNSVIELLKKHFIK